MFKSNIDVLYKFENIHSTPNNNDYIFIVHNNTILTLEKLTIPSFSDIFGDANNSLNTFNVNSFTYLFSFEDKNVFAYNDEIDVTMFNSHTLREFLFVDDFTHTSIAFTSYHLYIWYANNKFCSKCGKENNYSKTERALVCPVCSKITYPSISPAIIVGIHFKDNLLLTKYATGIYQNYALVAGFVEVGETLEQCVQREVFEEVGLKVKNIKYVASQPWGISQSLLAGFYAEVDGDDTSIKLDKTELREATWFNRSDLPVLDKPNPSLTWSLIDNFRNNLDFLNTFKE